MAMSVEEIKAALDSGKPTIPTVAALRNILAPELIRDGPVTKNPVLSRSTAAKKTPSTGNARPTVGKSKKAGAFSIHDDASSATSRREKYALATFTVNSSLKQLSDLIKSQAQCQKVNAIIGSESGQSSPPTPQRPLQARSANITPVRSPLKKGDGPQNEHSISPRKAALDKSSQIAAIAECAHLAFSFLLNADAKALGVKEMPRWQLETGLLALAGRLISCGLTDLAIKELHAVKQRLEEAFGSTKSSESGKTSRTQTTQTEKADLSTLLELNTALDADAAILSIVASYHQNVLKLILKCATPAVLERLPAQIAVDVPNGPVDVIIRHAKLTKDFAKGAKQLEVVSNMILSLGPSVASSADKIARNATVSPSPEAVFRLQTTALQIRKLWWKLAKHQAVVSTELVDPFYKCMSAYYRRRKNGSKGSLELLQSCFESIGPIDQKASGHTLFGIYNILCTEAESTSDHQNGLKWAVHMAKDSASLDPSHAISVAAHVRRSTFEKKTPGLEEAVDWSSLTKLLRSKITGSSADYDILIDAIASLSNAVAHDRRTVSQSPDISKSLALAASFCQRYARSYPDKRVPQIISVLNATLQCCASTDELLTWITEDSASVYVRAGALNSVIETASSRPLGEAWTVSRNAASLSRILCALLLKAARTNTDSNNASLFDDETLNAAERGMLLEWQLSYVEELVARPKYHEALKRVIPEILRRLAKVYTSSDYPIRRARVALMVYGIREQHSNLIPPHLFKPWSDICRIDNAALGQDTGLARFSDDLSARLATTKLFFEGQATAENLRPYLRTWQRILSRCEDQQALGEHVEDPIALRRQLRSTAAYMSMLGDDQVALAARRLVLKLDHLEGNDSERCSSMMELAKNYLALGYSERAGTFLAQAATIAEGRDAAETSRLRCRVSHAEYLMSVGNVAQAKNALEEARRNHTSFALEAMDRQSRKEYEITHAQAWLVCSKWCSMTGESKNALASAKRAVQILNSMWSSIERETGTQALATDSVPAIEDERAVKGLTKGISKLQLTQDGNDAKNAEQQSKRGAAFWPVVPVLIKALLHLSNSYAHHGLFNEADYYSNRAVSIAESVGSTLLLSRVRGHRCRLLTLAGRISDAELCLTQDETIETVLTDLTEVDRNCARAAIRAKEGSFQEAVELYERAEFILDTLTSEDFLKELEGFEHTPDDLSKRMSSLSIVKKSGAETAAQGARKASQKPMKKPAARGKPVNTIRTEPKADPSHQSTNHVLDGLKSRIGISKSLLKLQLGEATGDTTLPKDLEPEQVLQSLDWLLFRHHSLVRQATNMLETNVTLSLLPESTISFPALLSSQGSCSDSSKDAPTRGSKKATKAVAKAPKVASKKAVPSEITPDELFLKACTTLLQDSVTQIKLAGTSRIHSAYSSVSAVSMLWSAIADPLAFEKLHPAQEAFHIDFPRIHALQLEKGSIAIDSARNNDDDKRLWPSNMISSSPSATVASDFQKDYVDIIPKSWTAVSICLSDDGSELHIARYRSESTPLILKLPFARHKPSDDDDMDDDPFDYFKGKSELKEIIDLSNYTCHNPGSLDAKGAKTKWWKEREDLDRRLQELLINIENIWFGGFKAILSLQRSQDDALKRFRVAFDQILARYLPSRRSGRNKSATLQLDDQVLGLFTGLALESDGTVDLEESVTDLLYFVVDTLQFRGERNAYDEIDFDSMTIDVLDALRPFQDQDSKEDQHSRHLILVLDRRLQAFPWENLPFLEGSSVSRVGSMLSLRDCILSMRKAATSASTALPDGGEGCHLVPRDSGTYILNPSSDLAPTQTMLGPSLSKLNKDDSTCWNSLVNELPTEEFFSSALTDSSLTLYFGHGAGSQYIRPRAIKRLERCSEVVWLMGCSSGAVSEYGELEPCAVPLTYLLAGSQSSENPQEALNDAPGKSKCMSVVATLWDVTDKDIDRFSLTIGEEWGLWPATTESKLPAKTPKKREVVAQPATPVQAPKTPKTPKVGRTPAIAKTPARSRSRPAQNDGGKLSLVDAVARSRDACYLRYLNGAAPVVYGIPVYLGD